MELRDKFIYKNLSVFFVCLLIGITVIFARQAAYYFTESFSLILAALLAFLFLRNLVISKKLTYNKTFLIILAIIVAVYLMAVEFSVNRFESLRSFFYISVFLAVVFIIHSFDLTSKTIINILKYFVFLGLVVVVIGYYYYLFIDKDHFSSVFNNPNVLASFLLLILPISYYLKQKAKNNIFWNFQLVIFISAFLLTLSRGGLLSFFLASVIFALLFKDRLINNRVSYFLKRRKKMPSLLPLFMFFVFIFLFLISLQYTNLYENILGRFKFNYTLSLRGRVEFIVEGWRIFQDNILKGTGPGTYKIILPFYQVSPVGYSIYPHNIIIEMLSDLGLLGIIFLIFTVLFVFKIAKKLRQEKCSEFFYFVFLGFLSFLLNMLFEVSWHYIGLFFIFGVYIGLLTHLFKKDILKFSGKKLILATLICLGIIFWFGKSAFKSYWFHHYFELGKFYVETKQFKQAERSFVDSLRFFDNEENNYQLALLNYNIYRQTSDSIRLELAENFVSRSLRYNIYNARVYSLNGLILMEKKDLVSAENNFLKAVSLDKYNNPEYYINLGFFYYLNNRINDAVRVIKSILDYYPSDMIVARSASIQLIEKLSQAYYILALIHRNNGELNEARKYLIESLKIDKYNIEARRELNRLNLEKGL